MCIWVLYVHVYVHMSVCVGGLELNCEESNFSNRSIRTNYMPRGVAAGRIYGKADCVLASNQAPSKEGAWKGLHVYASKFPENLG